MNVLDRKLSWFLIGICYSISTVLWADDTELFAPDVLIVPPKIMLLIDTSGTMRNNEGIQPAGSLVDLALSLLTGSSYDGNCNDGDASDQNRKICILKAQLASLLDPNNEDSVWNEDTVEIGIAQFAPPGAIILAPVAPLGDGSSGTHRARLLEIVNNLQPLQYSETDPVVPLESGAPLMGAYLEVAEYLGSGSAVSDASVSYSDSRVFDTATGAYKGVDLSATCGVNNAHLLVITDGESACETLGSTHPNCSVFPPQGASTMAERISQFAQNSGTTVASDCNNTITTNKSGDNPLNRDYFSCLETISSGLDEIKTHVIGFGFTSAQTALNNRMSQWAAINDGSYYRAQNGDELVAGIAAVSKILNFDGSLTNADAGFGVNQNNVFAHGDELYYSLLTPSNKRFWYGNLKKYYFGISDSSELGIYFNDNKSNLALDSEGVFLEGITEWSSGVLDAPYTQDGTVPYVGGAAGNIPEPNNRRLFTNLDGTAYLLDGSSDSAAYYSVRNYMVEDYLVNNVAADQRDTERPGIRIRADKLMSWLQGTDELNEWLALSNTLRSQPVTTDTRTDRANRRTLYGAPLHSNPVLVNYRSVDGSGDPLEEPESLVFVSTNDGKLYAVDSASGVEKLAFIPQSMLTSPGTNKMSPVATMYTSIESNQVGDLIYGMDSTWTVWRQDVDRSGNIESDALSDDFVYLFGGMRRGGRNYYVLDATKTNDSSPVISQLAEIRGGESGTEWENNGQSWSQPTLAIIKYNSKPVAVFIVGGGYDTQYDSGLPATLPAAGAQVYFVVAYPFTDGATSYEVGDVLWWASSTSSTTGNHQQIATLEHSVPATAKTLDLNSDGFVDHVYVVDMGGQVHRLDIQNQSNTGYQNLVTSSLVAQLGSASPNAAANSPIDHRRFYYPPSIALIKHSTLGQFIGVALGSGWRANPKDTEVNEKFYFLVDREPVTLIDQPTIVEGQTQPGVSAIYSLGQTSSAEALSNVQNLTNSTLAFSLELAKTGEKFLGSPLIVAGNVYFSSYYLDSGNLNAARCEASAGAAAVYSFGVGQSSVLLQDEGLSQNVAGSVNSILSEVEQPIVNEDGEEVGVERTIRGINLSGTGAIGPIPLNLQRVRKTTWINEK